VHDDRTADAPERLPVGLGAQEGGPVAELGGQMTHPGPDDVQLLAVETLPVEHPGRLDQHDLAVAVLLGRVDVRAELVAEEPERLGSHHTSLVPRTAPRDLLHSDRGVLRSIS
jgi:hypothetical protein